MEMHWEWGTREERRGEEGSGGVRRMGDEWGIQDVMRRSTWFVVPLPLPPSPPRSVTCVLFCLSSLSPLTSFFPFLATFWIFLTPPARIRTFYFSSLTVLLILLTLLFLLSLRLAAGYTFILSLFLLGFSRHHASHLIPLRTRAFNSLFICPSLTPPCRPHPHPHHRPRRRRRRLPPWLAPSLCSAVKLVHWGSRKWGLETIERREM